MITDDAVALRTWEYSETSQTAALFTREHGVVRALAKGARRERSAYSGGIEVLTRGRAVAILKPTTDLATLTSWDLLSIYWRPRRDLLAHRVGLYLADLVYHAITDEDPHPGLYDILVGALEGMEAGRDPFTVCARFQWGVLGEIGSRPDVLSSEGSASRTNGDAVFFDPRAGRCVASPTPGVWPVQRRTIERIREFDVSGGIEADADRDRKPGRFLSEYLVHVIGRDLPTRKPLFGPLVMG